MRVQRLFRPRIQRSNLNVAGHVRPRLFQVPGHHTTIKFCSSSYPCSSLPMPLTLCLRSENRRRQTSRQRRRSIRVSRGKSWSSSERRQARETRRQPPALKAPSRIRTAPKIRRPEQPRRRGLLKGSRNGFSSLSSRRTYRRKQSRHEARSRMSNHSRQSRRREHDFC